MKKCKNCKNRFIPRFTTFEKFCWNAECKTIEALENLKKQKAQNEKKQKAILNEKKENLKNASQWRSTVQKTFNTFIRLRDQKNTCISCDKPLPKKYDAGHFFPVGNYPALRYNENNTHAQCVECNHHRGGNLIEYQINLEKKIGSFELQKLYDSRHEIKKYTIYELKELNELYKKKIENLKKNT